MKSLKRVLFFVSVFILAGYFTPISASAGISNRIVAIVNNQVITLRELNNKIRQATGVEPDIMRSRDEKRFMEMRRKVLELLIDEKLAQEKIDEMGINVTQKEVDEAIERIKKGNNLTHEDLMGALKREGLDYATYRESLKREMERTKLINLQVKTRIVISEEEIRDYYEKNQDQFRMESKIHLAAIFLLNENDESQAGMAALEAKAQEIVSRIESDEDFGKLAKEFSRGPGAREGGDLGFMETSQLDPELMRIVSKMSVGEVSKPIVRPPAVQIIKLLEKEDVRTKSFEEVKDAIFSLLYRQEVDRRYSAWIKELREKAYTKIKF